MQQSNPNEVFFKETVFKIIDMEIQYIYSLATATMREKLILFLFRHGKISQEQADLFDKKAKGVSRVRLSEFGQVGYTRSRNVDVNGYSRAGVSTKGKKTTIHLITRKGIEYAEKILEEAFPRFLNRSDNSEIVSEINKLELSPESFWGDEHILDVIRDNIDVQKRSLRLHDLTSKSAYASLLNCSTATLSSFTVEQRYDVSGECLNRAMSLRPNEISRLCRSDMYFRFEKNGQRTEYILEHDMCSEKCDELATKFEQYSSSLLSQRLSSRKRFPTILLSISTIFADKKTIREAHNQKDLDNAFLNSSLNRAYAGLNPVFAGLVADKLSDESMTVGIDDPLMTLGLVRSIIGMYGENRYTDFLGSCMERWGEDIPFIEIETRFLNKDKGMSAEISQRPMSNLALIKRRKDIYGLLLNNNDYRYYFKNGLSLYCTSIDRISGVVAADIINGSFVEVLTSFLSAEYGRDMKNDVSYILGGCVADIDEVGNRFVFPNTYRVQSETRPFVVENISSDVGALYRMKELTEFPSSALPFIPILLYDSQDLKEMDYSHRGLIKSFLRYVHSTKISVYTCEYSLSGTGICYGSIFKDQNRLFSLVR